MVSNLRRLAADHAALHSKLPPYYLVQPDDGHFAAADDLSQLTILLTGPPGTPYSQGLWRLQLKIPEDYPNSPPKATFRTRIWHPNVEEMTGAVCVDTLKRDWQSKLTLRDVLITISCLLINPNPDSALNSSAGNLLREDYDVFAHQARLMTSIHAPIHTGLQNAVKEAKHRGEEPGSMPREADAHYQRPRKQQRIQTGTTMKNRPPSEYIPHPPRDLAPHPEPVLEDDPMQMSDSENENDDPASASKENNPSLSPTPLRLAPPSSPRKNAFGKRPLSVLSLAYPEDPDTEMMLVDSDSEPENDTDTPPTNSFSSPEKNIAANVSTTINFSRPTRNPPPMSPQRRTPKLAPSRWGNTPSRLREDVQIYEDVPDRTVTDISRRFGSDGKENRDSVLLPRGLKDISGLHAEKVAHAANPQAMQSGHQPSTTSASLIPSKQSPFKLSKKVSGLRKGAMPKTKPRIGLRRL
ncbi:Ubiquitin-conjugating enzymeE2 [Penicillium lividum]|nr:Ubiquitin-conjugating enzymeE2 [Penicillium lividum]